MQSDQKGAVEMMKSTTAAERNNDFLVGVVRKAVLEVAECYENVSCGPAGQTLHV